MKELAKLRKLRGIEQKDLAQLMNVSQGTVSNWENGHFEPKIAQLYELAKILDCSIVDLTGGKQADADENYGVWKTWNDTIYCSKCGFGFFPSSTWFQHQRCIRSADNTFRPGFCMNCGSPMRCED